MVNSLNENTVIGHAQDLRPLRSVEGKEFLRLAQSLINFGAKAGPVDISSVILHRTNLKKSILPRVVNTMKTDLIASILSAPSYPHLAFSLDTWSEDFKKRQFLSLSVNYFEKEFELKYKLLGVEQFPFQQKTTVNIRREVDRILCSYFPAGDWTSYWSGPFQSPTVSPT